MDWLLAPDYWLARWVFERFLAAIYAIAFLLGGEPVSRAARGARTATSPASAGRRILSRAAEPVHLRYSDNLLRGLAWSGVVVALTLLVGLPQAGPVWLPMLAWFALWVAYLSIVNIGQAFYSFGWESLLVETGFLAIFLGNASIPPPAPILWLARWLLFRLEFGAGLIKIRHDPCWRDLTCLYYHHETQPMPNPLSWYFHNLPKWTHRMEVRGNHFCQLVVPFGLFAPQPVAGIAALIMIVHQLWLIASGNFAWLNWLTLALAIVALDNQQLGMLLPLAVPLLGAPPVAYIGVSRWLRSRWPRSAIGPRATW